MCAIMARMMDPDDKGRDQVGTDDNQETGAPNPQTGGRHGDFKTDPQS
jgi:hypothetical protein